MLKSKKQRQSRYMWTFTLSLIMVLTLSLNSTITSVLAITQSIVNENFDSTATGSFPSGWVLTTSTGGTASVQELPSASDKSLKLNDTSTTYNVAVSKYFTVPIGVLTAEFDICPSQTNCSIAAGYLYDVLNGQIGPTVWFEYTGNIKAYNGTTAVTLQSYTANTWYHMKYVVNSITQKYDVYVNGVLKGRNFAFYYPASAISRIYFNTATTNQTGSVYINNVKVYQGGMLQMDNNRIFDDFNAMTTGSAPTGWTLDSTTGGTATVQAVPSSTDKSIKINDTSNVNNNNVAISKSFTATTSGTITAEFEVRADQTNADIAAGYMVDSSGNQAVRLNFNSLGEIRAYNGSTQQYEFVQNYTVGEWYRIRIIMNIDTDKYDVLVNDYIKCDGLPFSTAISSLSKIQFYTTSISTGAFYIDNVNVAASGDLASSNFGSTFNYIGSQIGGGEGYNKMVYNYTTYVSTASDLVTALNNASSGNIIYLADNADLNLDSYYPLQVKAGVTLASGRGKVNSDGTYVTGGRLSVTPSVIGGPDKTIIQIVGEGARVTGLYLFGGDTEIGTGTLPSVVGIDALGYNTTEVDNCVLEGFRWAGVKMDDGYIHNCYFSYNRHYGLGYGVVQTKSNTTGGLLIEGCYFTYNRHGIAATGEQTGRYTARYNTVDVNDSGHAFDRHGDSVTKTAGDWTIIHHNTFKDTSVQIGIEIRDKPVTGAYINNNWFYDTDQLSDIVQRHDYGTVYGNMFVGENKYGVTSPVYATGVYSQR